MGLGMIFKMIMAGLVVAASSPVMADAAWVEISSRVHRTSYIDASTVVYEDGGLTKVWIRTVHNPVEENNISYLKIRMEFRCHEHMYRLTSAISYDINGTVVMSDQYPENTFVDVVPDTTSFHAEKVACIFAKK